MSWADGAWWESETDFERWLNVQMLAQGWHVQPLEGNDQYPGIPDMTAALRHQEIWAEIKMPKKIHHADDQMKFDRKLTAPQRRWLLDRQHHMGSMSDVDCFVIVAYRVGIEEDFVTYVTAVPINRWDHIIERWDIRTWVLSPYTARSEWLKSERASVLAMVQGQLTPGHGMG